MENRKAKSEISRSFLIVLLVLIAPTLSFSQEYPTKPIVLINPMGAGGSHDLTMRAVTSVAHEYLGQPMIIQIKSGGGGAIGVEFAAKAAPDGYTLLIGGPGWAPTLPAVEGRSRGPEDLMAICRINYSPIIISARMDAPFKTFKEMIAWAKANPGKLVFGNTGPWGAADMPWKQLMRKAGITTKVVPHDGGGPAMVALLGGHIDVTGSLSAQTLPQVKAGKVRMLAVTDYQRDKDYPEVPTVREEGVDVVYLMWRGILAPKGIPRPIVDKLADAFKKMTENKAVIAMLKGFGDNPNFLGPDEFGKLWREEFELHKELGKLYKK